MPHTSNSYFRLSSFYFFYFAVVGALMPYWGVYLKSLGFSSQDVGVMSATIFATRMVAPNFWGWIADKTQKRIFIIRLGCSIAAFLFLGVFISHSYIWLISVVSCYTFFWHAVLPQFEVVTLRSLGTRTHDYSKIRLWGSIGFIFAVVFLGFLFDWVTISYLPIAIFTLLFSVLLSSLSCKEVFVPSSTQKNSGFLKKLTQPLLICFFSANFLLQISHGTYNTFYSIFLTENYGYSSTATGLLWALGVLAEIGMFLVMPKALHRFGFRELLLASFFVAAVRWLVIGFCASSILLLLFGQLMHAFTFTIAHAVSIEVIRTHFGTNLQGRAQAFYSSTSFGAGGALGALISAFVWDYGEGISFLISSLAAVAGFLICFIGLHFKQDNVQSTHS